MLPLESYVTRENAGVGAWVLIEVEQEGRSIDGCQPLMFAARSFLRDVGIAVGRLFLRCASRDSLSLEDIWMTVLF